MNKKKSILESNVLYTIIAIVIVVSGRSHLLNHGGRHQSGSGLWKALQQYFQQTEISGMDLVYAAPLIFTGLSVAFSFRTGVFNIGAEGQFVIGGLVACILGLRLKLPAGIHAWYVWWQQRQQAASGP